MNENDDKLISISPPTSNLVAIAELGRWKHVNIVLRHHCNVTNWTSWELGNYPKITLFQAAELWQFIQKDGSGQSRDNLKPDEGW